MKNARFSTARGLMAALLIVTLLLGGCAPQEKALTAEELLTLGEQYLLDLDYEQALVQFLKVVEAEPMNARAYLGAADAYAGLGDLDNAIAILERGMEATGDESLRERYYALLRADDGYYTALGEEQKQLLAELAQALGALDWEAAYAIQSSAACVQLAAGLPLNKNGNRRSLVYYPDDTTRITFFQTVGESDVSSHMDLFRGTNGEGVMNVSVYGAHVHYRMESATYSGGGANGPFSGYYLGMDAADFYTVTGAMLDGMPSGDFTRNHRDGDVLVLTAEQAAAASFTKKAGWPRELSS